MTKAQQQHAISSTVFMCRFQDADICCCRLPDFWSIAYDYWQYPGFPKIVIFAAEVAAVSGSLKSVFMKKKVVVLTGAGISAESGIRTFRDADGLWEEYRIEEVATWDAWQRNPALVLEFYNKRRAQLGTVVPNAAHLALVKLEEKFEVQIITQNVDDLHERAGSANILHLHGELVKVRSTADDELVYNIGYGEIGLGDHCEKGFQLRPHIVWFGEAVPLIEAAADLVAEADILLIIGTSLLVYPAAGLMHYAPARCMKYVVDPNSLPVGGISKPEVLQMNAGAGVPLLVNRLLSDN